MGAEYILAAVGCPLFLPFKASLLVSVSLYICLAFLAHLSENQDPGFFELQGQLAVIHSPFTFYFFKKGVFKYLCVNVRNGTSLISSVVTQHHIH